MEIVFSTVWHHLKLLAIHNTSRFTIPGKVAACRNAAGLDLLVEELSRTVSKKACMEQQPCEQIRGSKLRWNAVVMSHVTQLSLHEDAIASIRCMILQCSQIFQFTKSSNSLLELSKWVSCEGWGLGLAAGFVSPSLHQGSSCRFRSIHVP